MTPLLLIAVLGVVLLGLWWQASRRHAERREGSSTEWAGAAGRPDLWTSAARCPDCRAAGGLLDRRGDEVWFTCLSCRARHRRDHAV